MRGLTVKSYYKHFLSIYGVLSASIGSLPLLSKLLPDDWARFLFPPLGNQSSVFRIATLILGALVTLIVYFSKDNPTLISQSGRVKALLTTIIIAVIALIVFFALSQRFVRSLSIPSKGIEVAVIVGYQRTDFADSLGSATDWELLRYRGITEEEIQHLWTPKSIIIVRIGIFLSYLVFLLSAIAASSLGVLFDKLGPPPVSEKDGVI